MKNYLSRKKTKHNATEINSIFTFGWTVQLTAENVCCSSGICEQRHLLRTVTIETRGVGEVAVVRPMLFLKKKTLLKKKEPSKNCSPILGVGASKSLLRPSEGFST